MSNCLLNAGSLQLLRPLMARGMQLNSRGPLWERDANRIDLVLCDDVEAMEGSTQERPLRSLWVTLMGVESRLGTWPSMILQVYIIW